jgi:GrpB-like predicted nucleotidyltransferase (UPF0157 family)/ubiquinone/menaquinone biosynthesis C-methylase UbiE
VRDSDVAIGREFERRTYRGIGPHPSDPRGADAAARVVDLIRSAVPGVVAEHVGSTAVPGLEGKNVVDIQITAEPDDVPRITTALLRIGFERQRGPDPWPPERPMLEGTIEHDGAVFGIHCHIVPTTDPDVRQMIAFRDLLRADRSALEAYANEKHRIAAATEDPLEYTDAKADLINRLLEDAEVRTVYEAGTELDRLDRPLGLVEFERTKEILGRHLPAPPADIADIGGGPGRYSIWLAGLGYRVVHRDVTPLHVERVRTDAVAAGVVIDAGVADARSLDLADASMDAILLLGPLYHLKRKDDRFRAFVEVRRVAKPGAVVFVAAISRWAARLHGILVEKIYESLPEVLSLIPAVERTGRLPTLFEGSFSAYCHRPAELRDEASEAGLEVLDLVNVEGIAFAVPGLEERLRDERSRRVLFDSLRALERVPELLGVGPHLLLTARIPA